MARGHRGRGSVGRRRVAARPSGMPLGERTRGGRWFPGVEGREARQGEGAALAGRLATDTPTGGCSARNPGGSLARIVTTRSVNQLSPRSSRL